MKACDMRPKAQSYIDISRRGGVEVGRSFEVCQKKIGPSDEDFKEKAS